MGSPVDDALDRLERDISFLESVIHSDEGYTETVIAQCIDAREDIATVREALEGLRERDELLARILDHGAAGYAEHQARWSAWVSRSASPSDGANDDDPEACLKPIGSTGYYCGKEMGHDGPCRPLPDGGGAK